MMTCAEPKRILESELCDVFLASQGSRKVVVRRHQDIYTCGDAERAVYFIQSGSIRMTTQSVAGKECLLRIQTAGEIFGELALLGPGGRLDTATAREEGILWRLQAEDLVHELRRRALCEEFILDLIRRLKDHESHITYLVTEPSRRRLGRMLLLLAHRIGTRTGEGLRINLWISHNEWAEMVGTTRPRVSTFIGDFKRLNLILTTQEHHLIVREARLQRYLGEL
jgi:CRP-like cAMP-binding protein